MNFLDKPEVVENLSNMFWVFIIAFFIAFLISPLVGKLAKALDVIDLPARMRLSGDRSISSRLNTEPKLRLGGLAILISIMLTLLVANSFIEVQDNTVFGQINSKGIFVGIIIIGFLGYLDDKYEISGKSQLFIQGIAAFCIVLSGITILNVNFVGAEIDLNLYENTFQILGYAYRFIFPADLIAILWIVGIINIVNWVGGIDGLNISISSIASFTLLLFLLAGESFEIGIAAFIAIHIGANLGFLPYNWNPSKIIPGSIGDYLNGYLLAVFAMLSGARWTATFILFGLIIIDAIIVIYGRFKRHPETRRNPLKILSISDRNHLHHRLLALGYSKKAVLFIEISMMSIICAIAVYFGIDANEDNNNLIVAAVIALTFIFSVFTFIFVLNQRRVNGKQYINPAFVDNEEKKEAVVKVIVEEHEGFETEGEDYERFRY